MSHPENKPIRRYSAVQYGSVTFENIVIPCAFGGEPGQFTAFILIGGICQGIGIDPATEIERIQKDEILSGGLYLVPFAAIDEKGNRTMTDYPAITLSRLHTWLAMIPSNLAATEEMRAKLRTMKLELVDVLYGYFGRPLLPPDLKAEEETYLSEGQRAFYKGLEAASQLPGRVNALEESISDLRERVERLTLRIEMQDNEATISVDQQEQLRAMIDILARKYQEKHGPGTYGTIENNLKKDHDFRYYKSITVQKWPDLVRDCVRMYQTLFDRGSRLPRVFEMAQDSINQKPLF